MNCSYRNIASSISLRDKIAIFGCTCKFSHKIDLLRLAKFEKGKGLETLKRTLFVSVRSPAECCYTSHVMRKPAFYICENKDVVSCAVNM